MEQEIEFVETLTDEKATQKEKYNKAVELLAGSESNLETIIKHYNFLDGFVTDYLKKVEDEKSIQFDAFIGEVLIIDLFINDMASFIGHCKITGSTIISKLMKRDMKEEDENRLFMKMLRIEKDLPKIVDTDYYEVILERQIQTIIEKAQESGFEGLIGKQSESESNDEQTE